MNPMRDALRAEWTKLRTSPGTGWLLFAIVVVTVGITAVAAGTTVCLPGACMADPVKTSLTGVAFGQAVVAVFAVLLIGGEQNMLGVTFAAMPRRTAVLAAKAFHAVVLIAVASAIAVALSLVVSRFLLPSGLPHVATGSWLRASAGSVLYLVLIGLLSLGIAAGVRDSAVSAGAVLGLLYILPIVASTLTDPNWQRHLQQIAPMSAGLAIQATQQLSELPIKPWAGLGVLGLWSVAAVLIGGIVLHRRDI